MLGGPTLVAALTARNSAQAEAPSFQPLSAIQVMLQPAPLPPMSFKTLDGMATTLAAHAGKPLVLNFWATWCIPCVAELPELDRLAAVGSITVLAASADRRGADVVKPFLAKQSLGHLTVLLDPSSDAVHVAGVAGFPTTLIFDAALRLRGRLEGPAAWGDAVDVIQKLTAAPG
jgi:thiol-disulfide isomerase/thioredoxin